MAWSVLSSASASSSPAVAATTAGINTTGATLIVVGIANSIVGGSAVLTDSKSNTWTGLTAKSVAGQGVVRLFYCASPTTDAAHTFTAGAQAIFGMVIQVVAVDGTLASSPFDAENGSAVSGNPGNVTNTAAGQFLAAGYQDTVSASPAISSVTGCAGANLFSVAVSGGNHLAMALAIGYGTSGAGGVSNLTFPSGVNGTSVVATFKIAASGGGAGYLPVN